MEKFHKYVNYAENVNYAERETLFSIKGRLRRFTFYKRLFFILILPWSTLFISFFALYVVEDRLMQDKSTLIFVRLLSVYTIFATSLLVIQIIKRLHDIDLSGFYLCFYILPIANIVITILILFCDSQPGVNKWGPNPKGINS